MKIGAVILAAGLSSRMKGGFKPLMRLQGETLVARCAALFNAAGIEKTVVVTGHRGAEVETEAKRIGLDCHLNPDYEQGMYSSVCAALPLLSGLEGFFLLPVDIPLVRPATLKTLINSFDSSSVLFPSFKGRCGHPPLIPSALIPAIRNYSGRQGLRGLLERQRSREVEVWDLGILMDGDTPEEYARLERHARRMETGEPIEAAVLATLEMPGKGVAHGRAVARVAMLLARALNKHGYDLDLTLVHNGALLHDVAKGEGDHERRGGEMLRELGLAHVADVVAAHRDLPPPPDGRIREAEVVCLADKLVRGNRRVSISQRYHEKLSLYANDQEACRAISNRLVNALSLRDLVEQATGLPFEEIAGRS